MFEERQRGRRKDNNKAVKETEEESLWGPNPSQQANWGNRQKRQEFQEDNGFPPEINKTMAKIKYKWDFMTASDVRV